MFVSFSPPLSLCVQSCDSLEKLKKKCETLEKELRDQLKFKEFYQFTFNFAKNPGQKGLGNINITIRESYVFKS